jgi:hypothetical protein
MIANKKSEMMAAVCRGDSLRKPRKVAVARLHFPLQNYPRFVQMTQLD